MCALSSGARGGARVTAPPASVGTTITSYYAAFVFDLDGNNIEAVCHAPE